MCSNTNKRFSTSTSSGGKWLILIIAIFSIYAITQVRPVAAGDEIPNKESNSTDRTLDDNNHQHQPEDFNPGLVPANLVGDFNNQPDISTNPIASPSNSSVILLDERSFLGRNHPLLITTIVGLALILLLVVHWHIETKKSLHPLRKKIVDLNRNLWKVSTAFENQQDDIDACKKVSLAYDESQVKIASLEAELNRMKQADAENHDLVKRLKRALLHTAKVKCEVEDILAKTTRERDEARIRNMLLSNRYAKLMEKMKPIHHEWERTKGVRIAKDEPLITSMSSSEVRKWVVESHQMTHRVVKGKTEEESSESSDSDPKTSSPKKKGFFRRAGGFFSRCLAKKKTGSKDKDVISNSRKSSRLVMTECVELRPP